MTHSGAMTACTLSMGDKRHHDIMLKPWWEHTSKSEIIPIYCRWVVCSLGSVIFVLIYYSVLVLVLVLKILFSFSLILVLNYFFVLVLF